MAEKVSQAEEDAAAAVRARQEAIIAGSSGRSSSKPSARKAPAARARSPSAGRSEKSEKSRGARSKSPAPRRNALRAAEEEARKRIADRTEALAQEAEALGSPSRRPAKSPQRSPSPVARHRAAAPAPSTSEGENENEDEDGGHARSVGEVLRMLIVMAAIGLAMSIAFPVFTPHQARLPGHFGPPQDYFELLGVPPNADPAQADLDAKLRARLDQAEKRGDVSMLAKVQNAYSVLRDPAERKAYKELGLEEYERKYQQGQRIMYMLGGAAVAVLIVLLS